MRSSPANSCAGGVRHGALGRPARGAGSGRLEPVDTHELRRAGRDPRRRPGVPPAAGFLRCFCCVSFCSCFLTGSQEFVVDAVQH